MRASHLASYVALALDWPSNQGSLGTMDQLFTQYGRAGEETLPGSGKGSWCSVCRAMEEEASGGATHRAE